MDGGQVVQSMLKIFVGAITDRPRAVKDRPCCKAESTIKLRIHKINEASQRDASLHFQNSSTIL